jgi:hypothetical protein
MNIAEYARSLVLVSSVVAVLWACDATAQTVKVTPLGSHTGELCQNDRALLFEDPTGVRILYDVGTAVAGGGDPRLGEVHVVLLSHAHGDQRQWRLCRIAEFVVLRGSQGFRPNHAVFIPTPIDHHPMNPVEIDITPGDRILFPPNQE